MSALGRVLLVCWVPITFIIFISKRPPRKALIFSVIAGWLLLPSGGMAVPGLPDYTKAFATTFGALVSVCVFDMSRLLSFRPKWYDAPVLLLCLGPIATSVENGLGVYDGFSASFTTCLWYGFPYLLGRLYLYDRGALTDALSSFVIATLFYAVPTLWEVRMSPQLQGFFYGISSTGFDPPRFGLGYRPHVFMTTGLELGLWIAFAAIFAYAMMTSRAMTDVRGVPMPWVTGFLMALGVLTKSVGAIVLMAAGIAILWWLRRTGKKAVLWVVVALPLLYIGVRMTGVWSGDDMVELTAKYLGPARASSLETRFANEDRLIARALERPLLGWGGHGRSRVVNEYGKDITLTDGLWVILLGAQGWMGLTGLMLTFLLPQLTLIRRTKGADWRLPGMQTVAATFIFCGILTIDSLLNSNPNPLYFMLIGGLAGFTGAIRNSESEESKAYTDLGDLLASEGSVEDAEVAYRTSMQGYSERPDGDVAAMAGLAEGHESLGRLFAATGREEEAEHEFRQAVELWAEIAESYPSADAVEAHSGALDSLARFCKGRGREEEAVLAWRASIEVLEATLANAPQDGGAWRAYADRHNDLAWTLALPGAADGGDPAAAALLAQRATTIRPEEPCFWNTLGVARFYRGDDRGAIEAVSRSVELGEGGNGFDYFVMAMACARLGEPGVAQQWFLQGEQWLADQAAENLDLYRVRSQAEALLAEAAGPVIHSPFE